MYVFGAYPLKGSLMKKKIGVLAAAALVATAVVIPSTASAAACPKKATVTMLGTIKPEIQNEFLAAVKSYNSSQKCYTVKSIPGDRKLTFLQNVTPMYAAKNAPTIMYTLQEIPDMADKVMDWKGSKLAGLVSKDLLAAANIGGKQVGVPSTAEAFGLLYNKTVLDKAGVDPKKIKTRSDLEAAFKKVQASGTGAVRFSAIWWSLGAHFSNIYFTNAAKTQEGRLKVLDAMADGSKNLMADPVFKNYLATFELLKKYNQAKPNTTDTEYDASVADLASGKAGFWFMGNWAEPNLLQASPNTNFGIMPLPISDTAGTYGNDSISVGIPGYFMIDAKQSTKEERAGAVDFLTWLYTSAKGQKFVAGPIEEGGMNFIPVYKGFKVQPKTFMAKEISSYVVGGKTLSWMNTYYPAGGQDKYGASGQKLMTDTITGEQYATELQDAWKGSVKTWRGVAK
jgi:raffinose/stachyose/melibiose transport system substrate-binding protein